MQWSRRALLAAGTIPLLGQARPKIKGYSLWPVRATSRTVWLIVQLHTDSGISGLGEASDAFGFASTSAAQAREMEQALASFAALVEGHSPLAIAAYRRTAEPLARAGGLLGATAYSAIEQALWDLAGQTLGVPTHTLFGGALRQRIRLYANINRATTDRSPAGFAASARQAVAEGYTALKAAPWDGYPRISARQGIDCTRAIREAVGPSVDVMVDVHSNFTVAEAVRVARELEPLRLRWYEEPVAPARVAETVEIARRIRQPIAGGEFLFGVDGFLPLCREKAAAVIMPDVKHCGGLLALTHIAAMAAAHQVAVAPHNPSGPVATVASLHAIAGLGNCEILELQWGEVSWRGELLDPPERVVNGGLEIPLRPGFGISWNEKLARRYRL
jgi:galactonate dehydratase